MRIAIGELARRTGVQVVTIRWYEAQGVITAVDRTPGGFRLFDGVAVRRLTFVRRARAIGFSLEETRDLLALAACARDDAGLAGAAERHLDATRQRASDLAALRSVLEALASGDAGTSPGDIEAALIGADTG